MTEEIQALVHEVSAAMLKPATIAGQAEKEKELTLTYFRASILYLGFVSRGRPPEELTLKEFGRVNDYGDNVVDSISREEGLTKREVQEIISRWAEWAEHVIRGILFEKET